MLGPSTIADRGRSIAEAMMVRTAYRLAGLMFRPMSMPIERFERMARVEAARLEPMAPPRAAHCFREAFQGRDTVGSTLGGWEGGGSYISSVHRCMLGAWCNSSYAPNTPGCLQETKPTRLAS